MAGQTDKDLGLLLNRLKREARRGTAGRSEDHQGDESGEYGTERRPHHEATVAGIDGAGQLARRLQE